MSEQKKKGKAPKEPKDPNQPKEKPLFLILIIMLVLILFLTAIVIYTVVLKGGDSKSTSSTTTNTTTETATQTVEVPEVKYSFEKDFVVNLSDSDEKKYLKTSVTLGYSSKKLTKELTDNASIIRDAINSVLRGKKSSDLTTKGTEDLKKELIARINPLLKKGKISDIYFNDFIVQ